ncbi:hypothetical protein ACQP1V_29925 [Microtetraspora malaysiensis]|uniref:hypothetical protein n=1 Tax=Microtetraspora malaysiensis TaxID=161358 RepID=UPI003D8D3E3E
MSHRPPDGRRADSRIAASGGNLICWGNRGAAAPAGGLGGGAVAEGNSVDADESVGGRGAADC